MLDLMDPIAVALAVARAFESAKIECALYGGLALAAYGEPRETRDADVAVVGVTAADGVAALKAAGLEVAPAFDQVIFGGNLISRITLFAGAAATGLNVADLVEPRSLRYARAALDRAIAGELRGQRLRVLAPEDFVLFKVLSTRDRDLEDAATVLRSLAGRIDLAQVRREAALLTVEISSHDVAGRLQRLLAAP